MTDTWHEELRAKGYRVTPQRQLVLEAVSALGHATPEDICSKVQQTARGVNISTVYRTLELLEELGLVTHTHLSHGAPTYHLAADADHVHLVCRGCGEIVEAPPVLVQSMVDELRTRLGFNTDVHHLTIFGRCKNCE
ncbi:transcriptional repressor [Acrocarpospora phusangensis]|uniref:Transcriptional repressor n=1 Tax=Acrocarpospora phusangensis TaxID=1070424 RepID=A0A919UT81_9ACTN|nr:Fur family transcriptional regulator [Acrocarpospora phusangensis]GIH29463.1 transcriptional repressor [Acrocarpospora phusangensis]